MRTGAWRALLARHAHGYVHDRFRLRRMIDDYAAFYARLGQSPPG